MRAFVAHRPGRVRGPGRRRTRSPAAGQVVVDVARVGICGTDVEFFTGEMEYLHQGHATYPMRLGPRVVRHRRPRSATASTRRGSAAGSPATPCSAAAHCRRCLARAAPRLRGPVRDRHPRRLPGRARRAAAPCRPTRCSRCPTPSTTPPARWSSRAATRCAPSTRPALAAGRAAARPRARHHRPAGRRCSRGARASRSTWSGVTAPVARLRPRAWASTTSGRPTTCPTCPSTPSSTPPTPPALPGLARRAWSSRAGGWSTSGCPGSPSLVDTRDAGAQGRHRGRRSSARQPGWPGTIEALRRRRGRPAPARRGDRRPRQAQRRPRRLASGRRRPRPEDPRRPTLHH